MAAPPKQTLAERLAAAARPPGTACMVGTWLTGRPDRAEWDAAFRDRSWSHRVIHDLMKEDGFTGTRAPVERHRKGECACRT